MTPDVEKDLNITSVQICPQAWNISTYKSIGNLSRGVIHTCSAAREGPPRRDERAGRERHPVGEEVDLARLPLVLGRLVAQPSVRAETPCVNRPVLVRNHCK